MSEKSRVGKMGGVDVDAGVGIGMVAPYGAPDEHHNGGNGNSPMRDRRRGQRYGGAKIKPPRAALISSDKI